jgi:hypothetical protein
VYATPAAVLVPGVGSSHGHVGVSTNADTIISPRLGAPQGSVFDRLRVSVHDRLGPSQYSPEKGSASALIDQTS